MSTHADLILLISGCPVGETDFPEAPSRDLLGLSIMLMSRSTGVLDLA